MSNEVKPQGPIQVIGGAWSAFEIAKKYGPWVMALIAWLVIAIPYMLGKSDKVPGLPPVMPQGYYVSDGVTPLKVQHEVIRFGRIGEEPVKEAK
jgi:hypothetical protein